MRLVLSALALVAATSMASAAQEPVPEAVTIGPWQVEAVFKDRKFERCLMTRVTDDGITVRFVRDAKGLDLGMSSPKWKLGRGKSYPVELAAGTSTIQAEVAASGSSVSVPITDDRFLKSLRQADGLDVKGEGSTIRVALEKSAAGLDRLESCVTKNQSPEETNPFVAPSRKP